MTGIENIGVYIQEACRDNLSKVYDGESLDAEFLKEKSRFSCGSQERP